MTPQIIFQKNSFFTTNFLIKAVIKEEPAPEKILQNGTFQKLMDSVKLINFAEELFNLEVKNMTDLMAERENARAEGLEQGLAEGRAAGIAEGKAEGLEKGFEKILEIMKQLGVSDDLLLKARKIAEESK